VEKQPKPGLVEILKNDLDGFDLILKQIVDLGKKISPNEVLETTGFSVSEISQFRNGLNRTFEKREYQDPEFLLAFKATFHDFGETRNQLKRFLFARKLAVSEMIVNLIHSLDQGSPIIFFSNIRLLFEYLAHAHHMMNDISNYHRSISEMRAGDVTIIGSYIHKYTMQTRIDWATLDSDKLEKYKKDDNVAEINQKSILDSIDIINKKVPRSREIYEFLCEFAHPNFGSYVSYHQNKYISEKTRKNHFTVINTVIGRSGEHQGIRAFSETIFKSLQILSKMLTIFIDLEADCKNIDKSITRFVKKEIKREVSENSAYWTQTELCPCGSGRNLVSCCVPKQAWNLKRRHLH
jgi:hypothetical protein